MATKTIDDPVNEEMLKQEGIPPGLSAQDAQKLQGKKEESLEEKVSAFSFKSMLELGLSTALGIYTGGMVNYLSVWGAYTAANWYINKAKTKVEGLIAEAKTSGIVTSVLANLFSMMAKFQSRGATALGQYGYATLFYAAALPIFNFAYHGVDYFYKSGKSLFNYALKPWKLFTSYAKELYTKRLKSEYLASTKSTYALVPFIPAISVFAPLFNLGYYKIAVSSVARFFYRLALGSGSKDKDADQRSFPQYLKESASDYLTWPSDARKKREEEEHKKKEQEGKNKEMQQQQMLQQMMQGQGAR